MGLATTRSTADAGHDKLSGGLGNDVLWGGSGNDTLTGGEGADTFLFKSGDSGTAFITDFQIGIDKLDVGGLGLTTFSDVQAHAVMSKEGNLIITAGAEKLVLQNIKLAQLSAGDFKFNADTSSPPSDNTPAPPPGDTSPTPAPDPSSPSVPGTSPEAGKLVIGTSGNDVLTGGSGHDTLDGGAGADTMMGGAGDDTYTVDHVRDVIVEMAGEGIDTVRTSLATYTLKGNLENLVYTSSGAFRGVTNGLDNVLTGGTGNDVLIGGAGHDTLNGGAGHDKLNGGIGNDVLWGGSGNDTLTGDAGSDVFVFKRADGAGKTFITDFELGTDKIDLSGLGYTSFADVQAHLSTGEGGFALISDAGHDILLQHVTANQLKAADFLYA